MMPHEFLGAGNGMLSIMNDIQNDGDEILAAGYTAFPEHSIDFPEGDKQIGIIVWSEKSFLQAMVFEAGMQYCPNGNYDDKTIQVSAVPDSIGDVTEVVLEGSRRQFPGPHYKVTVPHNFEGVTPNEYYVWKPDKPVTHPLGHLAVASEQ